MERFRRRRLRHLLDPAARDRAFRPTTGSTTYGLILDLRSGERWLGEEWSAKDAPQPDIYVRVIQTGDEMAWSSPVWVKPSEE